MSLTDLQSALALLTDHPEKADFEGPKDEELIRLAESALGLEFAPSYREFLKKLGCGAVGGREMYGLINENFVQSSVPDAIWLTLTERAKGRLPNTLVLISATGDGGYYAIDTSQRDQGRESPVVIWWPGLSTPKGKLQSVARDFGAFFHQQVRDALAE